MREWLKNMKVSFLLAAVLYIALGAVLLIWPDLSSTVICYAFGGVLLLYGTFALASYFRHNNSMGALRFELVLGALAAGLGLVFLLFPRVVLSFLPIIFGVYLAIDSALNARRAWEMRRYHYDRWYVALLLALLGVGLGAFIVFQPYFTAKSLIRLIGAVFLYEGISDLWSIRTVAVLIKNAPIEAEPIDVE